ncbi:hypothetical protein EJB05_10322, partial [Eragrostis curvula]
MAAMAQAVLDKLILHGEEAVAAPRAFIFLVSLFTLVLLPLLLRRFVTSSTASSKKEDDRLLSKLPSPPNKVPIFGHMHLMGALPHVSLAALAAEHGPDLMLLRLGAVSTVIASSARTAEAILRTHDHAFASRPRSMVADIILYGSSESCYAPYGEHFRKVRKLVTVHLLNSKKVTSYRPAREEEVALVMDKLKLAASTAVVVDMSDLLYSFANDLICRAVSGKFFRKEGRNKMFRELIDTNAALLGGFNLEDYFPRLAIRDPPQDHLRQGQFSLLSPCSFDLHVQAHMDSIYTLSVRRCCTKYRRTLLNKIIDDHVARLRRRLDEDVDDDADADFIDVLLSHQKEYDITMDHMKAMIV